MSPKKSTRKKWKMSTNFKQLTLADKTFYLAIIFFFVLIIGLIYILFIKGNFNRYGWISYFYIFLGFMILGIILFSYIIWKVNQQLKTISSELTDITGDDDTN